jgi:hypothetical protein
MDLKVEKALNENINMLEGNVNIHDQCETIGIEMDNDKVQSNGNLVGQQTLGLGMRISN